MSPVFPMGDHTFALHILIDGTWAPSHQLTKHQAECARIAARHLADYLTEAYGLDTPAPDSSRSESAPLPPGGTGGGCAPKHVFTRDTSLDHLADTERRLLLESSPRINHGPDAEPVPKETAEALRTIHEAMVESYCEDGPTFIPPASQPFRTEGACEFPKAPGLE